MVDVSTIGGKFLTIKPRADWTGLDLKCAIAKAWGTHQGRQRLISAAGIQLVDDGLLSSQCAPQAERVQLSLLILPKTQAEMDWLERWPEVTPKWLVDASQRIMSQDEFETRTAEIRVSEEPKPSIESSEDLLKAVRRAWRAGMDFRLNTCPESCDQVRLNGIPIRLTQRVLGTETGKVALAEVLSAIAQDPAAILPYVDFRIALEAVEAREGTYCYLPKDLQSRTPILYAALHRDGELLAEFLQTASKAEVRQWQWHLQEESRCLRRKQKRRRG